MMLCIPVHFLKSMLNQVPPKNNLKHSAVSFNYFAYFMVWKHYRNFSLFNITATIFPYKIRMPLIFCFYVSCTCSHFTQCSVICMTWTIITAFKFCFSFWISINLVFVLLNKYCKFHCHANFRTDWNRDWPRLKWCFVYRVINLWESNRNGAWQ